MHYQPENHSGLSSAENIERINAKNESDDTKYEARMNEVRDKIFAEPDELEMVKLLGYFGKAGEIWRVKYTSKYEATVEYCNDSILKVYDIEEI